MKIVFLDVKTIGEDIDLSGFDRLGEVVKYDFSTSEEVPERVQDADVIILNKVPDKTQENDCHNTHCDNDCLDVQIHKILHTNCNCCIKEFIDNLKCYELFKFYWKPILFRRNKNT